MSNDSKENLQMNSAFHPQTESERELLEDMDLWPDDWSLVSGRISEWERPDGQVLRARRVSIRPRYDSAPQVRIPREVGGSAGQ
jgi:hypothetical protein